MTYAITAATRLLQRPGQGAVLVVQRATLIVEEGAEKGAEIGLEDRPITLGSGEDCDLVLSDDAVSTRHFTVTPTRVGFLLEDHESTNGTFVDAYRVRGIYLPDNAEIAVGATRLRFQIAGGEVELVLSSRTRFGELLGHSDAMRRVFAIFEKVADTQATVLIEGESGTGKELAARGLHEASSRRDALFVAIDCGALPEQLIESELFGHAKGAFTGATSDKLGLFERAQGGSLFLDEIGELPLELQPKLLRAIETRTVRRLGEAQARPVDVRLIAATNRNLAREADAGRFRRDLYFRLSVIRVRMPALRERREEIPRLVAHFRAQFGDDPARALPASVLGLLSSHSWPGNVRELRNVVERLTLVPGMSQDFYFGADAQEALPPSDTSAAKTANTPTTTAGTPTMPVEAAPPVPLDLPFHEGKKRWDERFERAYLGALLRACDGNISELARRAQLSRQTCYRLLKRHALDGA